MPVHAHINTPTTPVKQNKDELAKHKETHVVATSGRRAR
jgi:hypothetical protein